MALLMGLVIIAAAAYAVLRRVEVRLALFLAALALGVLGGDPAAILRKFFSTFTSQQFVIPICTAMGFAYALRHTQCDQHLVYLLVDPLRRVRALLVPGAALAGFIVNIPIISQTSTAVAIGSVLVPLLRAAGVSPLTAGAVLALGASIGGELLNPGAPEFRTVIQETARLGTGPAFALSGARCIQAALPLNLLHLGVATLAFWLLSRRAEAAYAREKAPREGAAEPAGKPEFKINLFKAAVPMVPLALLFLTAPPFQLVHVPRGWLVGPGEAESLFESRLIGAAMLVGVVVAALTDLRTAPASAGAFFEGTGYALSNVISLIVVASCFGEGVRLIGLDRLLGQGIQALPNLLLPAAGFLSLGFAVVSGSGMAATQSLFGFFAEPALRLGIAPEHVGAVVSLGAAAGRTMSPVAAVVLMSASLTGVSPIDISRRVAGPLLLGIAIVVLAALAMVAIGWRAAPG